MNVLNVKYDGWRHNRSSLRSDKDIGEYCSDFYEYSCGGYKLHHNIEDGSYTHTVWTELSDTHSKRLRVSGILTGYLQKLEYLVLIEYLQNTAMILTGYLQNTYRMLTECLLNTYKILTEYFQNTYRILYTKCLRMLTECLLNSH